MRCPGLADPLVQKGAYVVVTAEQNSQSMGKQTMDLCKAAYVGEHHSSMESTTPTLTHSIRGTATNTAINCPAPAGGYTLEYPVHLPKTTGMPPHPSWCDTELRSRRQVQNSCAGKFSQRGGVILLRLDVQLSLKRLEMYVCIVV